ncbi:hypothetical protein GcM1_229043 [Golovinomyces cichoracearum]|uniref:Uncharacterized protein n=1 Tax=Golovinomyces cichoracearum TaxID=62708 RepID=A0A420INI4_9PEZI|nr:hypothetical protein GcM1_229043 [Golovinomyces cichoracearum]
MSGDRHKQGPMGIEFYMNLIRISCAIFMVPDYNGNISIVIRDLDDEDEKSQVYEHIITIQVTNSV